MKYGGESLDWMPKNVKDFALQSMFPKKQRVVHHPAMGRGFQRIENPPDDTDVCEMPHGVLADLMKHLLDKTIIVQKGGGDQISSEGIREYLGMRK